MPSPFSITVPSGTVHLNGSGSADVQFSVTNSADAGLRGRAVVIPLDGTEAGWLSIAGEGEHDFPPQGTFQYIVRVQLPPGTQAAQRRFRLDVLGVANPDEVFTQGQAVSFENAVVKPPEITSKTQPGYVATVVGALVGMLAGGSAGLLLGIVAGLLVTLVGGDLDSLARGALLVLLFVVVGPWVGATLGVRYNLNNKGYDFATLTSAVHAAMFPVVAAVLTGVMVLIGGPLAVIGFLFIALPGCVALPALGARATVWYVKTGKL